jgi:hypothetical protein
MNDARHTVINIRMSFPRWFGKTVAQGMLPDQKAVADQR